MALEPEFEVTSLWNYVVGDSLKFHGLGGSIAAADLARGSYLAGELEALRDRAVLLTTHEQAAAAVALLELDGVARRIVLCTSDVSAGDLAGIAATADTDAIVCDQALGSAARAAAPPGSPVHLMSAQPLPIAGARRATAATEWILLTSGTSGVPKLVLHTLQSLAGALSRPAAAAPAVWSTFYDIRRYGGLQIYLRAVLSGTPLVLSNAHEPTRDFLARAARFGVTHMSGTPSHWRRALMSGAAGALRPQYVRLSGEVADQPLLDQLRATYPDARIAHAFASTEAGVAFEVEDGLAGFPAEIPRGARRHRDEGRGWNASNSLTPHGRALLGRGASRVDRRR